MESKPIGDGEPVPERILGLDLGDRRIGIAVSGAFGRTAQPVLTLVRKNLRLDLRFVTRIMRKYGCAEVVVGNPLSLSGGLSRQAAKAQAFAQSLRQETGARVHLWDERLSTGEAHRYLDETGRAPETRRTIIDQLAAVLILQSFLDARGSGIGDQGSEIGDQGSGIGDRGSR